jgi:hypothetical protein
MNDDVNDDDDDGRHDIREGNKYYSNKFCLEIMPIMVYH